MLRKAGNTPGHKPAVSVLGLLSLIYFVSKSSRFAIHRFEGLRSHTHTHNTHRQHTAALTSWKDGTLWSQQISIAKSGAGLDGIKQRGQANRNSQTETCIHCVYLFIVWSSCLWSRFCTGRGFASALCPLEIWASRASRVVRNLDSCRLAIPHHYLTVHMSTWSYLPHLHLRHFLGMVDSKPTQLTAWRYQSHLQPGGFWVAGHVFDSGPNSKSRSRKQLGAKRKTLRLFNVIMSSCHPLTRLPTGFVRQTEWNPAAKTKHKGAPQLTVSGTVASLHPSAFTRYKQSMPKQSVQNCKRRHLTKSTTNYELVFCDYCDCVFFGLQWCISKIQPIPEDSSRTQGIVGVCQTSIRCRGRSWCGKCWRTVTRKMTVWHPRRWKQGRWKTVWNSSGRSLFSDFMHDLLTCKYSCMNLKLIWMWKFDWVHE